MSYPPYALREIGAYFLRLESRVGTWRRIKPEVWAVRQTGAWSDDDLEEVTGPQQHMIEVASIAEADGVAFLCPKCHAENGGPVGTHTVICWSPKVSQEHQPRPGRWNLVGTSLDDLELVAGSSSVLLQSGCAAHFFVRAGKIVPA